jgi:hypothetical protein
MQKQVELIKPYGTFTKGTTLTLAPPIADLLIRSGRAKAVEIQSDTKRGKKKNNNEQVEPSRIG